MYPTPDALSELFEAGDRAAGLLDSPEWMTLNALLRLEIATINRRLEGADAKVLPSRAEYAQLHGRLGGLKAAEGILNALVIRAETRMAEQRAMFEGVAEPASGGN